MENILQKDIVIPVDSIRLQATLTIPGKVAGMVIFSHGSGSSRFSPRNRFVADILNQHHIATLLADLLTPQEEAIYSNRFNIDLLTERLTVITRWILQRDFSQTIPIGYFGASTGAASAIKAAIHCKKTVSAVVSRGGRPDLAASALPLLDIPALLIVGSLDEAVLAHNRKALEILRCEKELSVVEGATHLFEEPGKLEEVARLATDWFLHHFRQPVIVNENTNH
jgi:putative phosphoribosyl transferase